ncbi:hypothetical protein [Geomicrobium sp. JCM 19055]|uniref:hypothetical protein n=1 Tax=Geomicrobium sp. JCM 19055 TaxID=1460649 RepID=UPI0005AA0DBA|nr:hypothetical protein [Geomicrobium sp. JCM 19055]
MGRSKELTEISNSIFQNVDSLTIKLLKNTKSKIDDSHLFKGDIVEIHYTLLEKLIKKIKRELIKFSGVNESSNNLDYDPKNQVAEMNVALSSMVELLTIYRSELLHYIQEECYENNVSTKKQPYTYGQNDSNF